MSVATVPKSEIRIDHNIIEGYAEVPARWDEEKQVIYWGLPGGIRCEDPVKAREFAKTLDREIRRRMKDTRELLSRTPR